MPVGECLVPSCPQWLAAPHGRTLWETGWALSDYTMWWETVEIGGTTQPGPHTIMGDLVYTAKYRPVSTKERSHAIEQILEKLLHFIGDVYSPTPPFQACVTAPSHSSGKIDLAGPLCRQLSERCDLEDLSDLLTEPAPAESVKDKGTGAERLAVLRDSLSVGFGAVSKPTGGILFVDDVFETGATARAVCEKIKEHYPQQSFHVITATRKRAKIVGIQ